jgi:uncharacterized membrane protein HdeD (DUF308 family)
MAEKTTPAWMRGLEIVGGVILLILAVWFLFNTNAAVDLVRTLLAIGLIILGILLLVRGATSDILSTSSKMLNILLGIIVLAIGAYSIYYPTFGNAILLFIFALWLLLGAIGRISYAGFADAARMPPWVKTASLVLGVIALILAIALLVWPDALNAYVAIVTALVLGLGGLQLIGAGASS